jgi:two-component system, NarL family, response regulator LiaR
MAEKIRVLIVDDHAVVRRGLCTLLASEDKIDIVGEACDGVEAVDKARSLKPDVILLDMVMPRKGGLEVINEILQENPDARILVLTSFAEDEKVFPAIRAGALGYLLKDALPEQLIQAIYTVYSGESALHPTIALKLIRELNQPDEPSPLEKLLTSREMEILKYVAQGMTNQDISANCFISERTVGNHISNILSKLHLTNRTQIALFALRRGLADLDESD